MFFDGCKKGETKEGFDYYNIGNTFLFPFQAHLKYDEQDGIFFIIICVLNNN